ncbi:competence protein ComGF [Salirhabdus euzebyi]|uniref:Competence protein ComGF n=1 Tax=Salirhabdus euzebyi TaxID=394506 RepID=A0A841Q769_9BACI|nr:ComGF family competence protein [Salirhabdus euzebyi]MBB6454260.1 competence protein ComGF [Salirhabdus euzebyi]
MSTLTTLLIFASLLPLLTNLLLHIPHIKNKDFPEESSVSTFFHIMQKEFFKGEEIDVTQSKLLINPNSSEVITIELYRNTIRRRVNYTGHEILLFNVRSITFLEENGSVYVNVEMTGGNRYERRLSLLY